MENVYFDTAASPYLYSPTIFESVARIVGAERILLGTDYPLLPQKRLLAQVDNSPLTLFQKKLILGENAQNLLSP